MRMISFFFFLPQQYIEVYVLYCISFFFFSLLHFRDITVQILFIQLIHYLYCCIWADWFFFMERAQALCQQWVRLRGQFASINEDGLRACSKYFNAELEHQ